MFSGRQYLQIKDKIKKTMLYNYHIRQTLEDISQRLNSTSSTNFDLLKETLRKAEISMIFHFCVLADDALEEQPKLIATFPVCTLPEILDICDNAEAWAYELQSLRIDSESELPQGPPLWITEAARNQAEMIMTSELEELQSLPKLLQAESNAMINTTRTLCTEIIRRIFEVLSSVEKLQNPDEIGSIVREVSRDTRVAAMRWLQWSLDFYDSTYYTNRGESDSEKHALVTDDQNLKNFVKQIKTVIDYRKQQVRLAILLQRTNNCRELYSKLKKSRQKILMPV